VDADPDGAMEAFDRARQRRHGDRNGWADPDLGGLRPVTGAVGRQGNRRGDRDKGKGKD
jgi:hypothetical protein